jgi:pyruvate dehydrogenase E2 component (dihydrolipoamide acetyltransferase)
MALHPLVMPKIGLTMEEGTVAKWHVPEGQAVAPGQHVADIEIEKSTNELESPAGGVLAKQVVAEGTVAPVGTLIGVLADGGEDAAAAEEFAASYTPA